MADAIDRGPSSSYSDPIYDRLDSVAQRMARRWPLFVLAILAAVALALIVRAMIGRDASVVSAEAFISARDEEDQEGRVKALRRVAEDESITADFRARAWGELAQIALQHGDHAEAQRDAAQASSLAATVKDNTGLALQGRLATAAASEDAGDAAAALSAYEEVERSAGLRFPVEQLAATLGAARLQRRQGDLDGAIARLQPVVDRPADSASQPLLAYARWLYWQCKRQKAGAADAAPTAAAPATSENGTAPTAAAPPTPENGAAPAAAPPAATPAAPEKDAAGTPAAPAASGK